jgi:hypothetical protein
MEGDREGNFKEMNKQAIFKAFSLILGYFSGIMKSYLFVLVFGLVTFILVGTNLEDYFVKLMSVTPGVGLGKNGYFTISNDTVLTFFFVWGLVFTLVLEILKKFRKFDFTFINKLLLPFGVILHLISFVVFGMRFNYGFALVLVGFLFVTYLLGLAILNGLNWGRKFLQST